MSETEGREELNPMDFWEDTEAAKKTQGLFANRLYIQHLGEGLVRLNFGEVLDEEPRYHSSIVLTAANAFAFGQLMQKVAMTALGATLPPTPEESERNPNVKG